MRPTQHRAAADPVSPTGAAMHILIAMCYLVHRSGAEMFTRDLALWLRRRGHAVTVFATAFGDMADELRRASIACSSDLSQLGARPDFIIGNTHHELVRAVLQFPDVPALSICHDRSDDHGRPPLLGQVVCHVAVDENCAERLAHEFGLPRASVALVQNGVDLQRFRQRAPLPATPRTALIFSNYATREEHTESIRAACADAGIGLDVIGAQAGNQAAEPADVLGRYDLVFGKGRCATEALATGCAVIVLDQSQGMGSLVTRASVQGDRLWNFGRRLMTQPITRERVLGELRRYDRADAQATADWARAHVGLDAMGLALEQHAREALARRPIIHLPPEQRIAELTRYVDDWVARGHALASHALAARLQAMHGQAQQAMRDQAQRHGEEVQRLRDAALQEQSQRRALVQRLDAEAGERLRQDLRHAQERETQQLRHSEEREHQQASHAQAWEQQDARHAQLLREATERAQAASAAAVEAMRQSRSWRITRPLRSIGALFRSCRTVR